ncbi:MULTISPECIES: DUF554 domain-containing protein [Pontibacillus]|uniref:DUF554 domain-containing protein n=1 Tax=Pontibacillus chungwhensis TaxID=265426 RepID=A0ABY8V011_9BACI|nr:MULTISPECIES: DUF554 domain-containing protein [Pontibacillus]MCD5325623.1 DUF554 domain-containing protein [Pontibacillus sp. HN14]WIF98129.1 DUF554 domain-containing protein [Pontibacillus chungwhensis]
MILFGTLVNGVGIAIGSLVGLFFNRIPEKTKETTMNGIGLAVTLIGLRMAIETDQIIVMLLSLLFGAFAGEWLQLEERFEKLGSVLESKFSKGGHSTVSEGFITASLIFVIGAMAVVGALDSGIRGDHDVLVTKAIIDAFVALVLTTTLGWGVMLSVIPVLLYEGGITLLATQIHKWIPQSFMDLFIVEMTATGGILIVAIGLNILHITKIRVANLLPSLLFIGFILYGWLQIGI